MVVYIAYVSSTWRYVDVIYSYNLNFVRIWRHDPPTIDSHICVCLPLQCSHNRHDGFSNQPHDCLLNRLFRCRSKKTSKLRVTGLCAGVTGEIPAHMASNTFFFISWRHHVYGSCIHAIRTLCLGAIYSILVWGSLSDKRSNWLCVLEKTIISKCSGFTLRIYQYHMCIKIMYRTVLLSSFVPNWVPFRKTG